MNDTLDFNDLEKVYDLLAEGIDEVGRDKEVLFLCKLCLALAHHAADLSTVENAIAVAKLDLAQ